MESSQIAKMRLHLALLFAVCGSLSFNGLILQVCVDVCIFASASHALVLPAVCSAVFVVFAACDVGHAAFVFLLF